jgi:hypothetical protein
MKKCCPSPGLLFQGRAETAFQRIPKPSEGSTCQKADSGKQNQRTDTGGHRTFLYHFLKTIQIFSFGIMMEIAIPLTLPYYSFKLKRGFHGHAKNQSLLAKRKFIFGAGFTGHSDLVQKLNAFLSVSFMASSAPADVP